MKERTVAPWNQHIVYLCYRFGYHINPPSNRCSSRDFLCCLLSRYFLNGCRFDFLSLSPDLTSCPDRCPLFFLFQVVVTRGGMRRSASPRDAPHRIRSFFALATRLRQLGQLRRGTTPVQPRALSPANLRIDSPPSRSAFQTVPGHPEADEAGCCVDIAGLGETGVDGQFQLRRGGRSPVQPCTPSPANVQTHFTLSRSTHQSIPGH